MMWNRTTPETAIPKNGIRHNTSITIIMNKVSSFLLYASFSNFSVLFLETEISLNFSSSFSSVVPHYYTEQIWTKILFIYITRFIIPKFSDIFNFR